MRILSLFSGIGAFEKALTNLNINYDLVNYCEIDKYASRAYSLIHDIPEDKNLVDVTQVKTKGLKDIDLITYGFPCQDISNSGYQKGFIDDKGNRTRSGLFYEALRIIKDTRPKFAIAENVKALTSKKFETEFNIVLGSLSRLGYNNYYQVLNAKDYGIPQNRERVFIISIRQDLDKGFAFPDKLSLDKMLRDLLEEDVDEKYYLSEDKVKSFILAASQDKSDGQYLAIKQATKKGYIEAYAGDYVNLQFPDSKTRRGRVSSDYANTLLCNDAQGVITDNLSIRKLTPLECFRLMGFNDRDLYILKQGGISDAQAYKMAGNSIVVNVLQGIFKELSIIYPESYIAEEV